MSSKEKDHWTSSAYQASASFVPQLTTKVLSWLSPQPGENILDIGCGDGQLTANIAVAVRPADTDKYERRSGIVLGLDASKSMIDTARTQYGPERSPNLDRLSFEVADCTQLLASKEGKQYIDASWDKVFSNAALHWILRDPSTRQDVFTATYQALRPGGTFVFEMGGAGNVAEIDAAMVAALVAHGVRMAEAKEARPWVFPSEKMMRGLLEEAGFEVERLELEYRPTKLTAKGGEGNGSGAGLEGWVSLMGAAFLEKVEEGKRGAVVSYVCELLENVVRRKEDGSEWLGYVRLRGLARKPATVG